MYYAATLAPASIAAQPTRPRALKPSPAAGEAMAAGSDTAGVRRRRRRRRTGAICAALLTVVIAYAVSDHIVNSGVYDCSPSDPDDIGGCPCAGSTVDGRCDRPRNFTVGEACEVQRGEHSDEGTCDAHGRCICQSAILFHVLMG